ncbi:Fatty acyl-CoA reductase 1 [Dichanthelium oligosanthes]|uniref:Fatty acyl-CoA reductase n=1 Tax=Dichanthelium oligosanthes TaxID=888268 RepID=A0A1E5W7C2_9POAL|nr:Fatty acyl-CoA reductase 1 [Dichanthelium oligosanthes]
MEPAGAGVAERLHSKTVLVTGATGFIAKLLVEKLLRLQPPVKRLYLLVRAGDQVSATERVRSEIMQLQIFRSMREKYQEHFSSWFWDKVYPVAGDVSLKNLGIADAALAEDILKETDIIVHMAATVNFRERYDTALAMNTMGVKHIIDIASRCTKLELLLLVSTAYVNSKESGIMLEKPLHQYRSYDGQSDLDISEEMALAEARLKELVCRNPSEDTIRRTMKKIGTQRAQKFGWTNTYVFTKAMGEMLAYEHRSRLPIAIIRPTSTTSTWKEPFPGWIEGIKTIDTWVTNYGKGHLKVLPGDVTTVIDIDMERRGLFTTDKHDRYNHLKREYNFTVAIAEVYRSGTFFKRRFDDSNMQRLIAMMNGRDRELVPFLVEKILRLQPRVKRLYLLVRAGDQVSAEKRVESELLQLQIFESLQEKYQTHFSSWVWGKVYPVAGDVSLKNLGIGNANLAEDIVKETNIIIHMAATVNFRERYDTALAINTMGVKHVIEFASRCAKLELVLLASTVFVNLDKAGIVLEKPLHQYRSNDGQLDFDISEETAFAEEKLKELVCSNASEDTIRRTMKKIGTQRARKFGWANAYAFTKAMGEMLAYEHRSRLPIVIIRPTATISTWKEPFPGWIEGVNTIDTWVTNYGKGHMKFLVGDVANAIDIVGYFSGKPYINAGGDVVRVKQPNVQAAMASFYGLMDMHYKVPLQDMLRRGLSTPIDHNRYNQLKREYNVTVAVAEAYWPVTLFKGRFDDSNMQRLITMMNERDRELIPCDTKLINWEKYLMETHIPGVMGYVSRETARARL